MGPSPHVPASSSSPPLAPGTTVSRAGRAQLAQLALLCQYPWSSHLYYTRVIFNGHVGTFFSVQIV